MKHKFEVAGPWITDAHCAYRLFYDQNGNPFPDVPENRACFIEKYARVQAPAWTIIPPKQITDYNVQRDHNTGALILTQGLVNFQTEPRPASFDILTSTWWYSERIGNGQECGSHQPSRDWCDKTLRRFHIRLLDA